MAFPKVSIESIFPCVKGCGIFVRPKRMGAEVAAQLVAEHHGPDAKVLINVGQGICSRCHRLEHRDTYKSYDKPKPVRATNVENIAAGLERFQRRRRQGSGVKPVRMGQSMVRI